MYDELLDITRYCIKEAKESYNNQKKAIDDYGEDSGLAALYDGERGAFLQVVGYLLHYHHVRINPEELIGTGDTPE